ncbi:pyridoxal-phosphate-dependent aminotransferase family protein [Aneurinibacillus aneurinilyticus]|jgi:alanine-glyoxylate transaminase/serine-glyoxylate transaminase/serine-pyruvate transaminase|nr:alanine--glyoxylate aminotransferase family protein [Aneurinibacillus aneurinilyticus]MCI1692716.1 alanine--glyoxylate aminotransferase family protein [Aneurinibacillus aneurinilyticus]MED0668778.1 alanine--glyoxylate aminotransferase family protein [Aneurinibacillus aneurinilyticus]MED0707232.1 alanine--glyoxylate aminotransferase family protein [Aneurinibacillus aneurinilyticus]MED0722031.1 alanine--glyoxylate aminotransferase family protein [Aneurinibacillus aneurinilyticus]MED0732540.1 
MFKELNPPSRVLMGPGPSDVHPRVLKAMATPLIGHLDPSFLQIMNETMELMRTVFETKNELTLAMSGTGSSGMETVFVNLLEPGDKIVIGVNGLFGERMVDVAERCGAEVIRIEAPWGEVIQPEQVEEALQGHARVKAVAVVHAETSTGALQPLAEISQLVHAHEALLIVDAVTSLGGVQIGIDENEVDACYSGTQKCISAPPGLSPVTFSKRAAESMAKRKSKVQSWYLDLSMIQNYWGQERFYHHTAPISMNYALREALRIVVEEGLENTWERHWKLGRALQSGLEGMGLSLHVAENIRLPQLTSVYIPDGVEDVSVRKQLLEQYGIEIGGGLGALKGKVWRVGLMGFSCQPRNVLLFLAALEEVLAQQGADVRREEGRAIAAEAMQK